jgi:hypothetical protein
MLSMPLRTLISLYSVLEFGTLDEPIQVKCGFSFGIYFK